MVVLTADRGKLTLSKLQVPNHDPCNEDKHRHGCGPAGLETVHNTKEIFETVVKKVTLKYVPFRSSFLSHQDPPHPGSSFSSTENSNRDEFSEFSMLPSE